MSVASAGEIISSGGKEVFDVNIVDVTNTNKEQIKKFIICLDDKNPMSISNDNKVGILKGVQYWADILAAGLKTTHPAQIFVSGMANEQNAYATSVGYAQGYFTNNPYWEEYLQGLRDLKNVNVENFTIGADNKVYENGHLVDNGAYGTISFGQFMGATRQGTSDGWWMKSNTVLPDSEQSVDGVAMIRHEVGHALGITAAHRVLTDEHGKPVVDQDGNTIYVLPGALTKNNTFLNHIYDQNLNRAGLEHLIVTSKEFERCHAADPSLKPSDFFIVDNIQNKNFTSENPRAGKAFFIGDNVSEVLKGRTFDGVDGLPLKTWEYDSAKNLILDLVHFEIGGLMSHDFYRNITVFNEAELASLQDIGHTIDRRAYFGYSIYNDNITFTNTNGYSARNNAGTGYIDEFSTIPLGIGLHVYGTNNNITQAANIWTKGEGAVGILVNGTGNKLTLAKEYEVHADGTEGVGVLVSYGSNQIFDQQGTVTADGEKGSGVRFDFGSNMLGADEVYRGSFIAYSRDVDAQNGTITKAENDNFYNETDMDKYRPELGGPLISEYNLSGTLSGGENAIYIGKNAFVQAINVNSGASINGNITSNWKQFGDPAYEGAYYYDIEEPKRDILRIQYNGMMEKKGYEYYKYIPDLVTSLNVNTDLKYDGKITGSDNMKLNVNAGTLVYGGAADVVNVNVAKGATLFGGKFTVNDMTSVIAAGFSDATTGKFYNHGTIGAATADDDMVINGNLISDGVLAGYAGGQKGQIVVSGTANVDGSMISIDNALPGDEMTVLKADSITGTIGNADESYAASGMLSTTGTVSGNEIKVQTVASNNLGDIDSTQQTAYNAMTDMYKKLSDTGD
ncbi:MAG: autotransporter outer membrane beta-barrel domain-containing protein, partial [Anaerovibrio sp.]|nr:autotransporter outer membrane beta-barrel domain-containing protein [Anaerovibrio sp.]